MAADPLTFAKALVVPKGTAKAKFGEIAAPFQIERFSALAPALLDLARGEIPEQSRFYWEATKGASKDSDASIALLWLLAFSPRPLLIQVAAGTQQQAGEPRKICQAILRLNPWLASRVTCVQWRLDCEATGSVCEILSSADQTSHGARPDFVLFDELTHTPSQEFFSTILDNSAKVPGNVVLVASNAGVVSTWQHEFRNSIVDDDYWVKHIYSQPAPWITQAELEQARKRNSKSRFLRLWYGVWSSGSDGIIGPDDLERLTKLPGKCPTGAIEHNAVRVGGLDLGIKRDHAGFCVLEVSLVDGKSRLMDCYSWRPPTKNLSIDLEAIEEYVQAAFVRYGLVATLYDPYQAVHMAQRLMRMGCNMIDLPFTSDSCHKMAQTLVEAVNNQTLEIYDDEALTRDLLRLQIKETMGRYKLTATRDENGHADRATALAIALYGCKVAYQRFALTEVEDTREEAIVA